MRFQAIQADIPMERFWTMTVHEFQIHRLAYLARQKEQWHMAAFQAAAFLNCWRDKTKSAISPEQLLGWEPETEPPPNMNDFEDLQSYSKALREYQERMNVH